jgi:hypothetical protein
VPGAFLPASHKVNLSRVMELLGFALSHFTVGPDARRLNDLIQATSGAAGAASQQRLQHSMLLDKVGRWAAAPRCGGCMPWRAARWGGWVCAAGSGPGCVSVLVEQGLSELHVGRRRRSARPQCSRLSWA